MVVDNFEIHLENFTNDVYYSGDTLNGFVRLVLNEPIETNGVNLLVNGKGHVQWSVARCVSTMNFYGQTMCKNLTDSYKNDDLYVEHEEKLWNKYKPVNHDAKVTLQPGSYELPFTFMISKTCPSSFEGSMGFVRYVCRASIGNEKGGSNYKCKRPFTVVNGVDLNKETVAHRPINDSLSKSVRSKLLGKSGTIDCTVDLPRCGYVPGETIQFQISIHNNSSVQIDQAEVTLNEIVIYTAKCQRIKGTNCSVRNVAKLTHALVQSKDSMLWADEGLLVPPVAPTLKHCSLIDASYELQFKILRIGKVLMELCFPIIIGTIPLQSTVQKIQKTIHVQPSSASPNERYEMIELSQVYKDCSNLPPPTYEVGYFKRANMKNNGQPNSFPVKIKNGPRYPYYDYLSNMPSSFHGHSSNYDS